MATALLFIDASVGKTSVVGIVGVHGHHWQHHFGATLAYLEILFGQIGFISRYVPYFVLGIGTSSCRLVLVFRILQVAYFFAYG